MQKYKQSLRAVSASLALCVLATAGSAKAAVLGYDYTGTGGTKGNLLQSIGVPSGIGTEGFEFALTQSTTITALGVWDQGGDGLATSHVVKLFANGAPGGTDITATVPAGTAGVLVNGFRFVALTTPVTLPAFGDYYFGAFYPDLQDSMAWSVPDSSLTLNGGFAWTRSFADDQSKFSTTTTGIAFPGGNAGRSRGVIGPNFLTGAVPVPEPTSLGMIAVGGVALLRRKRAN